MTKRVVVGVSVIFLILMFGIFSVSAKSTANGKVADNSKKSLLEKIEQYITEISKLEADRDMLTSTVELNNAEMQDLIKENESLTAQNTELMVLNEDLQNRVVFSDLWRVPVKKDDLIGRWEVVGFCSDPITYHIGDGMPVPMYLWAMTFHESTVAFDIESGVFTLPWIDNIIIHEGDQTASRFLIIEQDGVDYLYYEWKSGDYSIRGEMPRYYVLKRVLEE